MNLDVPVVGHEQPDDVILNARRKLFSINVENYDALSTEENDIDRLLNTLTLDSVNNSAENSPTLPAASMRRRRVVSFAKDSSGDKQREESLRNGNNYCFPPTTNGQPLPLLQERLDADTKSEPPLIRAKLVSKSCAKHILVLSFPRLVCDFWSSCLFMQQLVDAYGKLEKGISYRPSLASRRSERKRQGVMDAYELERRRSHLPVKRSDPETCLLQKWKHCCLGGMESGKDYVPMFPARLKFQQVALREKQLLLMMPREQLLTFWEAVVTTTIRRMRGMNRIKVVPPIRIPSGLGEVLTVPIGQRGRPQTSRLRPLTASRNRPMTGRRQMGGALGDIGMSREALLGPKTKFHFIKVCATI